MKKRLLVLTPILVAGVVALMGCGGGGSSSTPISRGATLQGTATVPNGTPTRAAGPDVALPGATVYLYDITTAGANALSGAPTMTTTTDGNGNYHFDHLNPGDNYIIKIVATVHTTSGATITLTLGGYAHLTPGATTPTTLNINQSSTVATSDVIQQITQNPSAASTDLTATFTQLTIAISVQLQNGSTITIDLTKSFTDPNAVAAFAAIVNQVAQAQLPAGDYIDNGVDSGTGVRNNLIDLHVDKTNNKVDGVLVVFDNAHNVFDADSFHSPLAGDGSFFATTNDGLYKVQGSMVGGDAHGTWSSVSGSLSGSFETVSVSINKPGALKGYIFAGQFFRNGETAPRGKWILLVRGDGKAWMFAHDDTKPNLPHLLTTALMVGTISSTGQVTGHMVFPANAGTITGTSPLMGGTVTGTGSGSGDGKTLSGTTTISGSSSSGIAQGTWTFSGLRNGNSFNAAGTWNGVQY